jgi:hypothetical protein
MQYLVHATGGPGFAEPERTLAVLEEAVLPTFDHLIGLEAEGKIRAGAYRSQTARSSSSSRPRPTTSSTGSCGISRRGVS